MVEGAVMTPTGAGKRLFRCCFEGSAQGWVLSLAALTGYLVLWVAPIPLAGVRPGMIEPAGAAFRFLLGIALQFPPYVAGALHTLSGSDLSANVIAFKALELGCLAILGALVAAYWWRTDRARVRPALFLVLWNPLMLWESAGAGHNSLPQLVAVLLAF